LNFGVPIAVLDAYKGQYCAHQKDGGGGGGYAQSERMADVFQRGKVNHGFFPNLGRGCPINE
jgi:hypothetical protein